MNFRSLLVFLDHDLRCDARVQVAGTLAAAHGSHLIGVAPTGLVQMPAALGAAAQQLDDADAARSEALRLAEECVQHFRARCRALGAESVEGHVHEGDKAAVVLHHAHCADLVVISQADPDSGSRREQTRFVEQVLLQSARPTLVVPHTGRADEPGGHVLIAWDDSPGCARAVSDALPLLKHARQVHLRVWRKRGEGEESAIRVRMDSVRAWLMRHGVSVEVQVVTSDGPVGDAILRHAAGLGVDLIVMGSYGHSRWTERLLGGATRTALARSPLPLLMSR